jgi:hypothetical protein
MDNKKLLNDNLNDRQKELFDFIDNIKDDYINVLIKKYPELEDFEYIDNVYQFSLLELRGRMKYINKYDKKLRNGGLVVKILEEDGKWIAMIKKYKKIYKVHFDNNYIFYTLPLNSQLRDWAQFFISDVDNGNVDIV